MKLRGARPPLVLSLVGLALVGCGGADFGGAGDKIPEHGSRKKMERVAQDLMAASIEQQLDVGSRMARAQDPDGAGIDLSGLPEMMRYPGATGRAVLSSGEDGDQGGMYYLESSDSVDDVLGWYQHKLASWRRDAFVRLHDSTWIGFTRGSNKTVNIIIGADGDRTRINVVYSVTQRKHKN